MFLVGTYTFNSMEISIYFFKEKYDDIYFDSDDESEGKESKKEKQKFKTDDDLLYDPNMDDEVNYSVVLPYVG